MLFFRNLFSWGRRREAGVLVVPNDEQALFPSLSDIYETSRSAFQRLLKRIRRVRSTELGHRKNVGVVNPRVGRNARPVRYSPGRNLLAPFLTLLSAVRSGRYDLARRRLLLTAEDLRGWDKVERRSLTLVMLVDTSRSSHYYIEVFRRILASLTAHFRRKRDRMGLIVLHGLQARILNHPTHNYRVVLNSLAKLKIHGESPLSDGLYKAAGMVRLERYRNPGSRSLVVLLSDCCPEPLTRQYEDLFEEPAYRKSILAAIAYRRSRTNLLVINPSCSHPDPARAPRPNPGEMLSERIASAARGRLLKIRRYGDQSSFSQREVAEVLSGIESAFQMGRKGGALRPLAGESGGMTIE